MDTKPTSLCCPRCGANLDALALELMTWLQTRTDNILPHAAITALLAAANLVGLAAVDDSDRAARELVTDCVARFRARAAEVRRGACAVRRDQAGAARVRDTVH